MHVSKWVATTRPETASMLHEAYASNKLLSGCLFIVAPYALNALAFLLQASAWILRYRGVYQIIPRPVDEVTLQDIPLVKHLSGFSVKYLKTSPPVLSTYLVLVNSDQQDQVDNTLTAKCHQNECVIPYLSVFSADQNKGFGLWYISKSITRSFNHHRGALSAKLSPWSLAPSP